MEIVVEIAGHVNCQVLEFNSMYIESAGKGSAGKEIAGKEITSKE